MNESSEKPRDVLRALDADDRPRFSILVILAITAYLGVPLAAMAMPGSAVHAGGFLLLMLVSVIWLGVESEHARPRLRFIVGMALLAIDFCVLLLAV